MSVTSVKNVLQVMIGKSIAATGASVQLTSPTASNYIADGEIVALNSAGTYLTPGSTISDTEFIRLAFRSGDFIQYSNKIYGKSTTKFTGVDGSQGQDQIYHIGYVGSGTNNIDVSAANDFFLNITYNHDIEFWSEQLDKRVYFDTYATPTARKLALSMARQINIDGGTKIKAEVLNSSTTTSTLTSGYTASVVKGSTYISMSGTGHGVSAGDLLRIGIAGSGVGVSVPVYEVASVSGATIVLNMPYQGSSNAALPADADMAIVTAGTYYGIRLTALPLDYKLDFFKFMRVSFTVALQGFGDTVITKTQERSMGQGDGRQVAELESFAQGFEGKQNRMTVPLPDFRTDAVRTATTTATSSTNVTGDVVTATTVYDCISLQFQNFATATATAPVRSSEELRLYLVDGASQSTGLLAQLNPYFESAGLKAISL